MGAKKKKLVPTKLAGIISKFGSQRGRKLSAKLGKKPRLFSGQIEDVMVEEYAIADVEFEGMVAERPSRNLRSISSVPTERKIVTLQRLVKALEFRVRLLEHKLSLLSSKRTKPMPNLEEISTHLEEVVWEEAASPIDPFSIDGVCEISDLKAALSDISDAEEWLDRQCTETIIASTKFKSATDPETFLKLNLNLIEVSSEHRLPVNDRWGGELDVEAVSIFCAYPSGAVRTLSGTVVRDGNNLRVVIPDRLAFIDPDRDPDSSGKTVRCPIALFAVPHENVAKTKEVQAYA